MARSGLRMMPTFPSPSLKFRTVSFPQYGFKAGISDKAFRSEQDHCFGRFVLVLRALCSSRGLPVLCRGTPCARAPPFEQPLPLYPRDPRSGLVFARQTIIAYAVPIRPTRRHIPTSPLSGLYEMPSLRVAARRPTSGSRLSLPFLLDMPPSTTPGRFASVCSSLAIPT
jgi:hypothetical protein